MTTASESPGYLEPYLAASRKYGAGFGTLLWASPKTQAIRFQALLKAMPIDGLTVMDVGCGRADLAAYILMTRRYPRGYIGLEAVEALAGEAEKKQYPNCKIIRGDFVKTPALLNTDADVLFYSGSLNTMDSPTFYSSLESGFAAARRAIVFNFLCSPLLAGSSHLSWHSIDEVLGFSRKLTCQVKLFNHYMRGDATIALSKDSK